MKQVTRFEATRELQKLVGEDLRKLAGKHNITVFKDGKFNKGWAGVTLERELGIGNNCIQASNGDYWELKLVPLVKKNGKWKVKETMAITMINPDEVVNTSFENSHLFNKMRKMIICGRERLDSNESESKLLYVNSFDLLTTNYWEQIKKDYEETQKVIKEKGFDELSGSLGKLIQPRTKGPGHGSKSRAFYARIPFVELILGINED